MNTSTLMPYALAAGILYAAYKFGPATVKAGAIAVGAVIVAKHVPYLNTVM